jgi:formate dehydrogenase assembly factor FdhD
MPYCPTCKQAYDDATECPDCKTALVDELPFQAIPGEGETWVEITSVGTDDEARLVQGFLEAEGIPAQIENVKFTVEPVNFGKMGEIRVYVGSQDEQRALELLRQREQAYENIDDDAETIVTDDGVADIDENAVAESE